MSKTKQNTVIGGTASCFEGNPLFLLICFRVNLYLVMEIPHYKSLCYD